VEAFLKLGVESNSNLSDKAGDLGQIEIIVKDMWEEFETKLEQKKAQESDKLEVNKNEQVILHNQLSGASKTKRRKIDDITTKSSDTVSTISSKKSMPNDSQNVFSSMASAVDRLTSSFFSQNMSPKRSKASGVSLEEEVEAALREKFSKTTSFRLWDEMGFEDEKFLNDYLLFESEGIDVLVNIFCADGQNFRQDWVKNEFSKIGLSQSCINKLYLYLKDKKQEYIREKNQATSSNRDL
jgi:hypothetical protein